MKHLFVMLIRCYQWLLSPAMRLLFGTSGACRFEPTCSCYAIEAFQRHGALRGLLLTMNRLLRCHPWGRAGSDPVPAPPNPNLTPNPNREGDERLGVRLGLGVREERMAAEKL